VRRLVIWEKPGEIIREIQLRRGLNIVWSPDPGAKLADLGRDAGSGHGAGKTLFCRFLRYCLGEETFANDELRRSISELLPSGLVGAELVIQGQLWAVIRPLGQTRKHHVRKDTTLEALVDSTEPGTGINPLFEVLDTQFFSGMQQYLPSQREHAAWLFALAWLTRDQECRFDHVLDWRHARADSRSITLGLSREEILIVARALLGVIDAEEMALKSDRERIAEERRSAERDIRYYERRTDEVQENLTPLLQEDGAAAGGGELAISVLRAAAEEKLQQIEQEITAVQQRDDAKANRSERDIVLQEAAVFDSQLRQLNAAKLLREEEVKALRGERANLDAEEIKTRLGPYCPVCNVPIDRALAEGCSLALGVRDHTDLANDVRSLADQTRTCQEAISTYQRMILEQKDHLDGLRRRQSKLEEQIEAYERSRGQRLQELRNQWFSAKRVVESLSEQERLNEARDKAKRSMELLAQRDREVGERQVALRNKHREALSRLEEIFSYICRGLLGSQVHASLALTGQAFHAAVEVGGMAMESLKAIAFDLAALLMSIEGRGVLPAFLIHDSPREADLGEAIYHRLFRLVKELESLSKEPPFQYLITTTTRPPEELCRQPYLVAQLHGSEVSQRFLRRDLG
jgi:hypothetical protein